MADRLPKQNFHGIKFQDQSMPVKDRPNSPCMECKEVRKEVCTDSCMYLKKWMKRIFGVGEGK